MTDNSGWTPLHINSFQELGDFESEILERISKVRNGGYLFILNPLLLLEDLDVVLSAKAKKQLLKREPTLKGMSSKPYHALKGSESEQVITVNVKSLFRRDSQ